MRKKTAMPPARKKTTSRRAPAAAPKPAASPGSDDPIVGVLCGQEVEVLPVKQWRKSAMIALQSGDLETWADLCLTDDGYDVWDELDPTFGEIAEFFGSFGDEMAAVDIQVPGVNRAQRRAQRRR
jgi:hypothetical protein